MTIDERIAAELRRDAPQVDEHAGWERIKATAPAHRRSKAIKLVAIPVAAVGFLVVALIMAPSFDAPDAPLSAPQNSFMDTWVTRDVDGSIPTMTIRESEDGGVEITVLDGNSSVCSGAPSTMTGTGTFRSDTELLVSSPVLTCDDGSQPKALDGRPLEQQLQNLTFTRDTREDMLTDSLGSVWTREGAASTRSPAHPLIRWPQTSLEEVQEAQERADAGDLDYTWQLEPNMESILEDPGELDTPEILARAVRGELPETDDLGWEEFVLMGSSGTEVSSQGIRAVGAQFLRCEPGERNPLWPDDPRLGGCAPTIDEGHYETAEILVAQPAKQGPDGIWVVSGWSQLDQPFEQIAPLTDDEIAAIVEPFLEARIAGEGAEQYLDPAPDGTQHEVPGYLYATSGGAHYERSEFEVIEEQRWPGGFVELSVRLFAEGGETVVEQTLSLEKDRAGMWRLFHHPGDQSTENGQPLPRT